MSHLRLPLYFVFFSTLWTSAALADNCKAISSRFGLQVGDFAHSSFTPLVQSCQTTKSHQDLISLRKFVLKGETKILYVDPKTMLTGILPESCLQNCKRFQPQDSADTFIYSKTLLQSTQTPGPVANAGIQRSGLTRSQIFLSVDLCPSHKPLDSELFERIQGATPSVPVAISISGNWLRKHTEDFQHLLNLADAKKLRITWVNHSNTHPYIMSLPDNQNFLLLPETNFASEVLDNEKLMLSQGIIPSVFFRFPGLISSNSQITQLRAWGLIPVGSDAWLAEGHPIHQGSIILVHGNGNESHGLTLLYQSLATNPTWKNLFADLVRAFY